MRKAGDLWDDSALINAFDDAVSKYKKMHAKKNEGCAVPNEKVDAEESVDDSQKIQQESRDVNGNGNVVSSTMTDTGETGNVSSCWENNVPDPNGSNPIVGSSNGGVEIHNADVDAHPCSQGIHDYNQLLSQYYELEEKRQKVLEQLNQSGGWNYQYYSGDSSYGVQFSNPGETSEAACQYSQSNMLCSCCPYACQLSKASCVPNPPCLGGTCVLNPCNGASVANGPVHPVPYKDGIPRAANKDTEKETSTDTTNLGDGTMVEGEQKVKNHKEMYQSNEPETDLTTVLNAWYSAGFITGKYVTEQSIARRQHK